MGKNKKDYHEEVESYSYGSESSIESGSSESSGSESSESESSSSSSEKQRRRRHVKKKSSKMRKERRGRRSDEAEGDKDTEHDERRKRKKRRHEDAERYEDEYVIRGDERKHRSSSRKHKHHHRKHKHKHRHRKRHHSEERRRGESRERSEGRRGRDGGEERRYKERIEYGSVERERRGERDGERRSSKEDKRLHEKYEGRQARSKWDEDEDTQYDSKRIKVEPDLEEEEDRRRGSRSAEPRKTSTRIKREPGSDGRRGGEGIDRDQAEENIRPEWGLQAKSEGSGDSRKGKGDKEEREKPNLGLTGKLTEDSNTYNGVVIKYSQPPEARKPKRRWRWYIFKGDEDLPFLPLHRQSAYLIGRDRKVADIPTDHPSCSKQHAVLQYRLVAYQREDGTKGRTVKPYILDLDSANGTFVNNRKIEPRRFVELLEKDVVKFGYSSREYILLHEGSKGDDDSLPDTGIELSPVSLLRS